MDKYYIDPKVISILMGLEKEEEIEQRMDEYYETRDALMRAGVRDYMVKNGSSQEEIDHILDLMKTYISGDNEELETNKELKDFLSQEAVAKHVGEILQKYNEQIYAQHYPSLPQEKKDELLEYNFETKRMLRDMSDNIQAFLDLYEDQLSEGKDQSTEPPVAPVAAPVPAPTIHLTPRD